MMLGGLLGFTLFWRITRKRRASQAPHSRFIVFEKGQKRKALHESPHFNWLVGMLYAMLFFWFIPILWWRYGIRISVLLIVLPLILPLLVTATYNTIFPSLSFDRDASLVLGLLLGSLMKGAIGVYIASIDTKLSAKNLLRCGWQKVCSIDAPNGKIARQTGRPNTLQTQTDSAMN